METLAFTADNIFVFSHIYNITPDPFGYSLGENLIMDFLF